MQRSLRQIDSTVHWTHEITLEGVMRVISRARIEKVLSSLSVSELRKRKLTRVLRVVLCIAMDLLTQEAMDDVMDKWVAGARCLRPVDDFESAGARAICQRRQQFPLAPIGLSSRRRPQPGAFSRRTRYDIYRVTQRR